MMFRALGDCACIERARRHQGGIGGYEGEDGRGERRPEHQGNQGQREETGQRHLEPHPGHLPSVS